MCFCAPTSETGQLLLCKQRCHLGINSISQMRGWLRAEREGETDREGEREREREEERRGREIEKEKKMARKRDSASLPHIQRGAGAAAKRSPQSVRLELKHAAPTDTGEDTVGPACLPP